MDENTLQTILSDLHIITENQSVILSEFKTIEENQSVIITEFDTINSQVQSSNVGIMMVVLVLGILVGIGFASFLKGGKK